MRISEQVFGWTCEAIIKNNCHLELNRLEHEDVNKCDHCGKQFKKNMF